MRRRTLLGGLGGLGALATGGLPLLSRAEADRFFLFVFCNGGWDQTRVFAPVFDGNVEMEQGAEGRSEGGIDFVHSSRRPAVTAFFEEHAARTCLVNGLEVQSVSHLGCTQLLLSANRGEDWASQIAHQASGLLMPHVLVSGPGFSVETTSSVVRVGETGQLSGLLDGSALDESDLQTSGLSGIAEDAVDAWVSQRARERDDAQQLSERLTDLELLLSRADSLPRTGDALSTLVDRSQFALSAFEDGLSCVATLEFLGYLNLGWDQHSDIMVQNYHFDELFEELAELWEELEARNLASRTTVVVLSEMGRTPTLNSDGGRDHWTFTSAMFLGHGVQGGQMVGGWDENCIGTQAISTLDLGATILALAGLPAPNGGSALEDVLA